MSDGRRSPLATNNRSYRRANKRRLQIILFVFFILCAAYFVRRPLLHAQTFLVNGRKQTPKSAQIAMTPKNGCGDHGAAVERGARRANKSSNAIGGGGAAAAAAAAAAANKSHKFCPRVARQNAGDKHQESFCNGRRRLHWR